MVKKKREYDVNFLKTAESTITEEERPYYKQLFKVMVEKYCFIKPAELVILDRWCYNTIRMRRVQNWLLEKGELQTITSKAGVEYTNVNAAVYYLNSIQAQMRADEKQMLLTPKEDLKKSSGMEQKDFSKFMADITEVDAEFEEVEKDGKDDT